MTAIKSGLLAPLVCSIAALAGGQPAVSEDRAAPEPMIFLPAAAQAMKAYKQQHREYSSQWRLMEMLFRRDDWPTQQNKELWQPRGFEYVYRIASADRDHFLIQALGRDDEPCYEITDGMNVPRALPAAAVKPIRIHPDIAEPRLFLPIAAASMNASCREDGRYPSRWNNLRITFSAIPYRIYDLNIRPGDSHKETWMPRGCEYAYRIAPGDGRHFLIQALNERHEVEYQIRDGMLQAEALAGTSRPLAAGRIEPTR